MYRYFQPNKKDLKDKCGDCVIRAICRVTDKPWNSVFKDLCDIALDMQRMPNDKDVFDRYLKEGGFEYIPFKKSRPTVKTVSARLKETYPSVKTVPYVAYCRAGYGTHLVAVMGADYFDTWDSGQQTVYGAYIRKENK